MKTNPLFILATGKTFRVNPYALCGASTEGGHPYFDFRDVTGSVKIPRKYFVKIARGIYLEKDRDLFERLHEMVEDFAENLRKECNRY